jgi:hypothetical protein
LSSQEIKQREEFLITKPICLNCFNEIQQMQEEMSKASHLQFLEYLEKQEILEKNKYSLEN